MASLGGNVMSTYLSPKIIFAGIAGMVFFAVGLSKLISKPRQNKQDHDTVGDLVKALLLFCYSCFFKPYEGDGGGNQQEALESFYAKQAGVYDVTRQTLLKGREDMLGLVAAQLQHKVNKAVKQVSGHQRKCIWVDVGGGTGFNIEAMAQFVKVPEFFSSVYLVDFSPSLCEVARERFTRLGWTNVKVICQDARKFRLGDHEADVPGDGTASHFAQKRPEHGGADLITMSYSLSMIPDFFSVVDSLASLLSPNGIMGVVDFYVQSKVDVSFRNYTGGLIDRHVNLFSRIFWRTWFDVDRVALEPSRRDYLEYRFGTVLTVNSRNYTLGWIPYYIWLGCHKRPSSLSSLPHGMVELVDGIAGESWYQHHANGQSISPKTVSKALTSTPELRSKSCDVAVQNLSADLPLPSFFYQNHPWRFYYDDQLSKHTQFEDEYIYAFTWEDSRVDEGLLKLGPEDVVLAITSAGDNILSYAMQSPARMHAVDLNPTQNHLLELKVASFTALSYDDFWKIFGEGKHPEFRSLLISKLSPHLSSRAFQYWLRKASIFTKTRGRGLYDTGGSKHAIRMFRWVSKVFGCRSAVLAVLQAKTLKEQREIWQARVRPALLSSMVCNLVVSSEAFLWAALGVPKNQLAMIEADHAESEAVKGPKPTARNTKAHAIWHYMVNTLDPMVEKTHIAEDNPYYYVCMEGAFSRRCHPDYLSPEAHSRLSRPGAFDGLRMHTDDIDEVIARITPGTLTVAVVMDSMDWFDPKGSSAALQITKLNRALKMGGRVLLRSGALRPWYIETFESHGFSGKRVGNRIPGELMDRVNMYASCWICTKTENLPPPTPDTERAGSMDVKVKPSGTL